VGFAADNCPITLDMLNDFEQWRKKFWADVREHTSNGELDLGEWDRPCGWLFMLTYCVPSSVCLIQL
jgi:hypothetical protein